MLMKVTAIIFSLLCFLVQAEQELPIVVDENIYREYLCLVNGRDILAIEDFGGPCSKRVTVDIILIQQMLAIGGFKHKLQLEPGYYNLKERKLIKQGLLLVNFDSLWKNDAKRIQDDAFISPPIIREGEYIAGFYTTESNVDALSITSIGEFKNLSAVSSKFWTNDWQALKTIDFKELYHEPVWNSQAMMVKQKLADVMLIPFSNNIDMTYEFLEETYRPIPNFKLRLAQSRHIAISKSHPLGEQAYQALVKGMKILREKGRIVKAYHQAGLFNDALDSWQVVN